MNMEVKTPCIIQPQRPDNFYIYRVYEILDDPKGLGQILLEINDKIYNRNLAEVGQRALLFYLLIEQNFLMGREDLKDIIAKDSDYFNTIKDQVKFYYTISCHFIDMYDSITNDQKTNPKYDEPLNFPDYVYEQLDDENLMEKIILTLYVPLINVFFELGLLDVGTIIKTTKNFYLECFENFATLLTRAGISNSSYTNIIQPIHNNIFQESKVNYKNLFKLISLEKNDTNSEDISCLLKKLENLNDLMIFLDNFRVQFHKN